jgi:hypothetical protein
MQLDGLAVLFLGLVGAMASVPASASSILYDDSGPTTYGLAAGLTINGGYAVTDSFTLAQASTITGADFGIWLYPGDSLSSVEWSIGTSQFSGTPQTAATSNLGQVATGNNGYYPIDLESIDIGNLRLGPGTYWFTLQDASATNGDGAYWDESNGPSSANQTGTITRPSESFQMLGTTGQIIPEPASFLLFASGLAGLAGIIRRGLKA